MYILEGLDSVWGATPPATFPPVSVRIGVDRLWYTNFINRCYWNVKSGSTNIGGGPAAWCDQAASDFTDACGRGAVEDPRWCNDLNRYKTDALGARTELWAAEERLQSAWSQAKQEEAVKLTACQAQISQLQQNLADAQRNLADAQEAVRLAKIDLALAVKVQQDMITQRNAATAELERTQQSLKEAQAVAQRAIAMRDEALTKVQALEAAQAQATSAAQASGAELAALRAQLATLQQQYDAATAARDANLAQAQQAQAALAEAQAQAAALTSREETAISDLNALRAQFEAAQAALAEAQARAKAWEQERQAILATGQETAAALQSAQADLLKVRQELGDAASAKTLAFKQAQDAQALVQQAQADATAAREKAAGLQSQLTALQLKQQQAQADLDEAEDAVKTLMTALGMTQQQVDLAKTRMALVPTEQIAAGAVTKAGLMGLPPWAVIAGLGAAAVYAISHARNR